jgi:hypothetical protein
MLLYIYVDQEINSSSPVLPEEAYSLEHNTERLREREKYRKSS